MERSVDGMSTHVPPHGRHHALNLGYGAPSAYWTLVHSDDCAFIQARCERSVSTGSNLLDVGPLRPGVGHGHGDVPRATASRVRKTLGQIE
jgi:hypothetical protein